MPEALPVQTPLPRALLIAVLLFGALGVGAIALWAHYGTRVFFEMIAAGIAACF